MRLKMRIGSLAPRPRLEGKMKISFKMTNLESSRLGVVRPIASIDFISLLVGLDIRADFFDDARAIATKDGRER